MRLRSLLYRPMRRRLAEGLLRRWLRMSRKQSVRYSRFVP